jgi:nucleoside-diphosphate-sugar epimerase
MQLQGRLAIDHSKTDDQEASSASHEPKAALILGVTGIVGNYLANLLSHPDAAGGPWKVYGLARRPRPSWLSHLPDLEYVQCDLLDREKTLANLSKLTDVTHIFFVTWVAEGSEAERIVSNSKLLQNTLDGLIPHAKDLQHIVLQTGGKHYVGPFEFQGKIQPKEAPFVEDGPRLPCDQFYHAQEDIIFELVKHNPKISYSIHRPTVIFGFAAGNLMNMVGTLAVYAVICKHEGMKLVYPGNEVTWNCLFDASDGELIAEQEIWACVEPKARNQAFNSSNGDVFKWKRLWHLLAERFGLEIPEYSGKSVSLVDLMHGKEPVWDKIVKENGLHPVKLADVGHWWFCDIVLNQPLEIVSSMNKSREFGFLGWRNSEKSFMNVIDEMKKNNLIP